MFPHCHEITDLLVHLEHLLFEQALDLAARRSTRVADLQNLRQFREREAGGQRMADQTNPVHGFGRIQAVIGG